MSMTSGVLLRFPAAATEPSATEPNAFEPNAFEPNDSILQAYWTDLTRDTSLILSAYLGDSALGSLTGDYDYFQFTAVAGEQITLSTRLTPDITDAVDTVLALYASDGILLAANDDSGADLYSHLVFDLPQSGNYAVLVYGFGSGPPADPLTPGSETAVGDTGFYDLTLTLLQPGPRSSPQEPNDSIAQATATGLAETGSRMLVGEIGDGEFGQTSGDFDYYQFSANAGDIVSLEISAAPDSSSISDTVLAVYNPAGEPIALNDDTGTSLFSALSFVATLPGDYYAVVYGHGSGPVGNPFEPGGGSGVGARGAYQLEITLDEPPPPIRPGFQIDLAFADDRLSPSQQALFLTAAERWSSLIVADIADIFIPDVGLVDDLLISISSPNIDGPGGILGQAGPTFFRPDSSLPGQGFMEFDRADLAVLEANGDLEDTILHEMAHVLGFGTIWDFLTNRQGQPLLDQSDPANPRFTGPQAVAAYNTLFGLNETSVPVEQDFGPSTALSHWDEDRLGDELMTGFLNSGSNPLSRLTLAALADLGYTVDLTLADAYSPPIAVG